jgi:hypothetical protein
MTAALLVQAFYYLAWLITLLTSLAKIDLLILDVRISSN